jgi:hypothetical protein
MLPMRRLHSRLLCWRTSFVSRLMEHCKKRTVQHMGCFVLGMKGTGVRAYVREDEEDSAK